MPAPCNNRHLYHSPWRTVLPVQARAALLRASGIPAAAGTLINIYCGPSSLKWHINVRSSLTPSPWGDRYLSKYICGPASISYCRSVFGLALWNVILAGLPLFLHSWGEFLFFLHGHKQKNNFYTLFYTQAKSFLSSLRYRPARLDLQERSTIG